MAKRKNAANEKAAVNVHELAEMLGISIPSAYDLVKRDGFPAIRVTERRIIIPVEALNRWLNEASRGGGIA
jgi:excisionase family DNA binding protein